MYSSHILMLLQPYKYRCGLLAFCCCLRPFLASSPFCCGNTVMKATYMAKVYSVSSWSSPLWPGWKHQELEVAHSIHCQEAGSNENLLVRAQIHSHFIRSRTRRITVARSVLPKASPHRIPTCAWHPLPIMTHQAMWSSERNFSFFLLGSQLKTGALLSLPNQEAPFLFWSLDVGVISY